MSLPLGSRLGLGPLAWIEVPRGFVLRRSGADTLLLPADGDNGVGALLTGLLDGRLPPTCRALPGGRGGAVALDIEGADGVVLRKCLRGGVPGRIVRGVYLGCPLRPFREVVVAEELRGRGVAVPESLGAIIRCVGPLCYRGALATREIRGGQNVWEYLRYRDSVEDRRKVCAIVGEAVRELHGSGVIHPDLNLTNFLVAEEDRRLRVWIVDCDRVRLGRVSGRHRRRAWQRIRRSARRLDPHGRVVDPSWLVPPGHKA